MRSLGVRILMVSILWVGAAASASAIELRISTLYPDGTNEIRMLREAGSEIATRTDNRVTLRLFPGGVMGDDQAVQRRIRAGQLHGALVQTGVIAQFYPDIQILNAPFVFSNYEQVDHIRSAFDQELEAGMKASGIHTFGLIDGGFAYVMSEAPKRSVTDLQDTRLWLPADDDFSLSVARAFGVSPITLGISEVLTGLQTGTIETIIAPPTAALALQWFSRVDYITDFPLIYTAATLYIDERHMGRLSDSDRAIVNEVLGAAAEQIDTYSRENNRAAYEALLSQGLQEVVLTDQEENRVRRRAQEAAQVLIEQNQFSRDWYQRLTEELSEFRSNR